MKALSTHPDSNSYLPPPDLGLEILYVDEHLLALNKPSGLLSVPGRGASKSECLLSRAQKEYPELLAVHRLDMGTSGVMLFARDKICHRQLSDLFAQRQVQKKYGAIVTGRPQPRSATINAPLICDWPNRPKQKIDSDKGKQAITEFTTLQHNEQDNTSYLEIKPLTGRSHQIRVHMASIGHAILGDTLYASESVIAMSSRLLLHAEQIEFLHPKNLQPLRIDCPAPFSGRGKST